MSDRSLTPPVTVAKRRALRRRRSAGGTMFVVAMTLAVLSTIGAWALQSAALEVRMAGYERQSTQTHYLAEYGVIAVMQDLSSSAPSPGSPGPKWITDQARTANMACLSLPCLDFTTSPVGVLSGTGCSEITPPFAKACFRWEGSASVVAPLDVGDGGVSGTPGSLGATSTQGNISAELTELAQAPSPGGSTAGCVPGGAGMCSYWATVTSYGQTSTSAGATSQGTEQLRARVLLSNIHQ